MSTFSAAIRDFIAAPEEARRLGPYRCKELLDKAGTAPVYKAVEEHAGLSLRNVAVKVFDIARTKAGKDAPDGWQARVVDEARALCRVQHPNVIRFHTLATDPKRGLMGLVMEFAEGISVDRQLKDLPVGDARRVALAVEVGINIASALGAAHEAKIVHCNVKPSNVMFTDGTHKLINFGIAAALRSADGSGTESERRRSVLALEELGPDSIGGKAASLVKDGGDDAAPVTGTIGYIDPVCLRTMSLPDATSDLYSLGATLYQCLAGDVPAVATRKAAGSSGVDAKVLIGDAAPVSVAEVASFAPADLVKLVDSLVAPSRDARPHSEDAVRRSLERIRSALAGHERALPPESRGPFPGLARYEASDRDVFFGRSAELAGAIELARTRGLVGLVGVSGTGKSSLARAGIVPAIEEGALEGWPTKYRGVVVTPGADLMAAFTTALKDVLGAPLAAHPAAIAQQLADDVDQKGEGIVILVDQLEELVTLHDPARAARRLEALDLLSRLADAPVGVRVIVTARRDLLDEILAIDAQFARALARGVQPLGPLSGPAWGEVLDQSLEAYGYALEDADVRREILTELRGRESAMALAQFALARLWEARDAKAKKIGRAALTAKGGMRGALEQHGDATVGALTVPRETVRELLLTMTTPEGTRAHVGREALTARFGDAGAKVVDAFVEAHLVVDEQGGLTFAHDAVLREWPLLRGWIEAARDDRMLVSQLERDAARWDTSKDAADLWRKGRLAAAVELWRRGGVKLSDGARAFLHKSHREEQKVRLAFASLVALVVFLLVGGSIVYAKESSDRAAQAQRDAEALAAALAEVKVLKRQADENGMEAAATAQLLNDLQKKIEEERATFGANVAATLKKVATATNLDTARKATTELNTKGGATQNQLVPLPMGLGGGPGPGPSTAGTFDQAAIERVVNTRKTGVKRMCLERSSSTASSTKVTATITIAPTGSVQSVASQGDDPVVAKCIEQQLKNWTFPPPGEVKQVQIPFVFVRQ